ncbi:MAG: PD-(D/E)XK nuclease family protein [Bryobacteraceae bacterium]|nr:PD-(D/E)XK nuclease family protein [Bryobacteraceae bacterium]
MRSFYLALPPLQTARDYHTLLTEAASFLRTHAAQSELLLIAPTRTAADDLVRLHCPSLAGVHRFTLHQLAATLAAAPMAERGLAPVNHFGLEALAARAVHTLSRQGMRYFQPVASSPGFARALARTLSELRLERADKDALAATGEPGADLAALLDLYQGMLLESRLADLAEILRLATLTVQRSSHRLTGLPTLLLDLPVTSQAAAALIDAITEKAPHAALFLITGDEETARRLKVHTTRPHHPVGDHALHRLRQYLFAGEVPTATTDESLDFFSAAGEGLECIEIARRIHARATAGVPFDQQAILLRGVERYQPLLEEALNRAGVPYYFTHGSVRPDPAGRAFLALLACASENYTASRFAEYLSLGQTPAIDQPRAMAAGAGHVWTGTEDELLNPGELLEETAEAPDTDPAPATPSAWEKLIVDASVVGGKSRWQRRLAGLEAELRLKLDHAEEDDESHRAWIGRQIELLGNLQRLALPVIDRLDSLPVIAPWGEWLEQLTALAQSTLRRPGSVLMALNELWPMAEVGPIGLDEVFLVLSERLRFLRRAPDRRRYGQVWIGSIGEARGQSFHTVYLPGLAEGIFPRKAFEDPLLLDTYRVQLEQRLPRRETRVAEERLRLRIAAAAARESLVVSYPRMDVAQGRPRVPSFYAMEVVRAAEGRLPELREFERRAATGAMTRLGWPAPSDKRHAVDSLEFDLATLQAAFAAPPGQSRGKGRYLMHLNAHVGRSLRHRRLRWERKWSTADGLMGDGEDTRAILAGYTLRQRPYSPSTLQHYAACPYRFALHGIHKLRPREEPVALEEMDPLTRGALFHSVLFELAPHLRNPTGDLFATASRVLDSVAARYEDDLAPAIPRVWRGEVEDLRADLNGWLRRYASDTAGWELLHAEYAFGLNDAEGRDAASTREHVPVLDGILLKGSMDWVERHKESGFLRITDHKTGRAPTKTPHRVGGGAVLQPLLYALAAEFLLEQPVKLSRLYFCTQRGAFTHVEVPVNEDARRDLSTALRIIDESIRHAQLPAAPQPDACKYCDYRIVCGPREEERVKKRKPALAHLVKLRSMP